MTTDDQTYVCDLVTSGKCTPKCLLALGIDKSDCRCACGSKYHGVLAEATVDDVWKAELYDKAEAESQEPATDPTPDLCCTHGQQLIERAEKLLDLLEARHDRTAEATTMADPDVDPVVYAALDRMQMAKRHHQGRLRP